MKYNQYAYVKTGFNQQVKELIDINFLPRNYEDWSFSDLLAKLVKNAIAEAKNDAAKTAKLNEFAVSDHETLADFLKEKPESIGTEQFYNVALQLLGYHVHYDYQFDDPTGFMQKNALPFVQDISDTNKLISAFYRLLNTRSKNGQILATSLSSGVKTSSNSSMANLSLFLTQTKSSAKSFMSKLILTLIMTVRAI